jgi:DNA-binding IclR family transcriptional regulator
MQVLLAFESDGPELAVGAVASKLGLHKSTASRVLATLAARGFVERIPGRDTFRLGPTIARLGLLAPLPRGLLAVARAPMEKLVASTGETVNVAVLDGLHAANIGQVDGDHIVGVGDWRNRRTPLHCTANGKVLLAFCDVDPGQLELTAVTPRTITDAKTLAAEIAEVRRVGWASALSEYEPGLHAVAAPVNDNWGVCRGALSVSGPSYRMPSTEIERVAEACREAAAAIGHLLTDTEPPVSLPTNGAR